MMGRLGCCTAIFQGKCVDEFITSAAFRFLLSALVCSSVPDPHLMLGEVERIRKSGRRLGMLVDEAYIYVPVHLFLHLVNHELLICVSPPLNLRAQLAPVT
ncbi:hypothetical protein BDN70DRAFT_494558 [Pholiota conissans]|uniref:Uncharacterized protein n=1 Tax=Pholiota conissans TaxID=109636 RepID=A0A9P5YP87_9AGAR|nr:hypothetical protein BDN70DRAFT_494558 [Pholiota conissans]